MNPAPLFWQLVIHEIENVSSLTTLEFINLVAHYHRLTQASSEIKNRGYSEAQLQALKEATAKSFSGLTSVGLHFSKPLEDFHSDILNYSLVILENYERGSLPFEGSISEQPAQIIEIFGVLQSLRYEREEIERKKQIQDVRKQHKNKSRYS